MSADDNQSRERTRSALTSLATVGATVAAAGVGALIAPIILPIAWFAISVGLIAHLFGMIGVARLLQSRGYAPPAWQTAGYWLCWALIAGIVAYGLWLLAR